MRASRLLRGARRAGGDRRDVLRMGRHRLDTPADEFALLPKGFADLPDRHSARQRIEAFCMHALSLECRGPADRAEQLILLAEDFAVAAIKLDPSAKAVRDRRFTALLPEGLGAAIRMIVKDDEVAHLLDIRRAVSD